MPNERGEYKSIEEVRSTLYPGSEAMLELEREDVLEFPTSLADKSLQIAERIAKRAAESGTEQEPAE